MPNKKTSKKKFIIIGIIVLVVVCAGITAYIIYAHSHNSRHFNPNNPSYQHRGNFTFDNASLAQVTSYLNSNTDTQAMASYCQQNINMLYCRYYCMRINPNNSVCSQLPTPQYRMNYTGAPPQ